MINLKNQMHLELLNKKKITPMITKGKIIRLVKLLSIKFRK